MHLLVVSQVIPGRDCRGTKFGFIIDDSADESLYNVVFSTMLSASPEKISDQIRVFRLLILTRKKGPPCSGECNS